MIKIKIAIVYDVIYPYSIGGTEKRNYEIAKRLAKKHEVHIFGVKMWKGADVIKQDGITIHGICRYKNMYHYSGRRTVIEPIKFAIALFKPLMKHEFDIIETSSFPYLHCFTCKLVSLLKRKPLIFVWLQFWGDYWHEYAGGITGFVGKIIEKYTLMLTKNHVSISQTTKKDLIKAGMAEKNVFVNYCGVDLEDVRKANKKEEKNDVVFVGRLAHQKNVGLLVHSVQHLKKTFPDIKVCIIGDGPERKRLEGLSKKLGLEKNITFKGFVENSTEVYSYMKSSKIFALPSLLEGLGIVVIEAQACGLPTVVADAKWSASKELVDDKWMIAKNNPEYFAGVIKLLLQEEKLRKEIGKQNVINSSRFSWDILADELEKYYEYVLLRRK